MVPLLVGDVHQTMALVLSCHACKAAGAVSLHDTGKNFSDDGSRIACAVCHVWKSYVVNRKDTGTGTVVASTGGK
jgi:hypothetical protein